MRFSDHLHFHWLTAIENNGTSLYRPTGRRKTGFFNSLLILAKAEVAVQGPDRHAAFAVPLGELQLRTRSVFAGPDGIRAEAVSNIAVESLDIEAGRD